MPGGKLAGAISLKNIQNAAGYAEIGYELFPEFQGRGIMTEAMKKMIEICFDKLRLKRIEAYTHRENLNSIKLLHKFNFKEVVGKTDPNNANNIVFELFNRLSV
jgi:[ribosomal protein S5]-alanine N-acetyltransferase